METWSRIRDDLPTFKGLILAVMVVYICKAMKTWEVAKGLFY